MTRSMVLRIAAASQSAARGADHSQEMLFLYCTGKLAADFLSPKEPCRIGFIEILQPFIRRLAGRGRLFVHGQGPEGGKLNLQPLDFQLVDLLREADVFQLVLTKIAQDGSLWQVLKNQLTGGLRY